MQYRNIDKQALKENGYTVLAKISIVGTDTVFTEDDYIVDWDYEDYRYVPNNGFIGQFVERILDGNLQNISDGIILEDTEINLKLGIKNALDNDTITWYDYGNFLITNVEKTDTTGNYRFESADYTKKFNIPFKDYVEVEGQIIPVPFPMLAVELMDFTCFQAGVTPDYPEADMCSYYIVPEEGLNPGNYYFEVYEDGTKYINFTTTSYLGKNSVLLFIPGENKLIQKFVGYSPDHVLVVNRTELTFTKKTTHTGSLLEQRNSGYIDFTNNDFVIESNQYDSEDTCRKVMQDIAKLAYSWVRIGEDNKVHIDFTPKSTSDIDQYDQLTTDEYYVSKKSDLAFGPVNKVLIGMSDVEGENMYKTSQDYTEETECAIKIYDNNLTNTDELRAIALYGAERLFGLQYTPIEINSVGHPWLDGDELIKLTNVDNEVIYTYPFNRKIHYAGYIEGVIGAEASTTQNTKYEYKSDIISNVKRTAIIVDKQEQTITALAENVDENSSNISQMQIDLNGIDLRVQSVETTEVTGVTNEYAVNDDATNPPAQSSSDWSTTKPTRGEGEYIWARIKTTYKSGNVTYSNPVNTTGDKGDTGGAGPTGPTGDDGKGIVSVTELYYVSNSSATPAKPTAHVTVSSLAGYNQWNLQCPPYVNTGQAQTSYIYFFTCSEILYTDNTYGWTNVTQNQGLAIANQNAYSATTTANSAFDTVNNLQVGGTNLLENSTVNLGTKDKWSSAISDMTIYSNNGYMNYPYFNYTKDLSSASSRTFLNNNHISSKIYKNDTITISGYCRNNSNTITHVQIWIRFGANSSSTKLSTQLTLPANSDWIYFEKTGVIDFDFTVGTDYPLFQLAFTQGESHNTDFCLLKVEKGNIATSWSPAPEDTDNTISELNTYVNTNITNLQNQIDGAIQFWNGSSIPTLSNYPASSWTTEAERINHQADIYTVIEDVSGELKQGKSYRFDKVNGTWQWIELTDNELSAVQALASSKAKVYVTQPTVPYNVGDLWLKDNKLYRCKTAKDSSGSYSANDWQLATNYTDDTVANQALNKINNLEIGGRNLLRNTKTFKPNGTSAASALNGWCISSGITLNEGSDGFSYLSRTTNTDYYNFYNLMLYETVKDKDITISFEYKNSVETQMNAFISLWLKDTETGNRTGYHDYTQTFPIATEWTKRSFTYHIDESIFTSGTITGNEIYFVPAIYFRTAGTSSSPSTTFQLRKLKVELGNVATDWSPAPEDTESKIPDTIVGTQTTNTRFWTGVASFTELQDGQEIMYWNPLSYKQEQPGTGKLTGCAGRVDSSHTFNKGVEINSTNVYGEGNISNVWLNLTLPNNTETGWIPCYYGGASRLTSHYDGGKNIHLTYKVNANVAGVLYTGWFADANYDSNNIDRLRFQNNIKADQMYLNSSRLIVAINNGNYIELNRNCSFRIDKPILMTGSNINILGTNNNTYLMYSGIALANNLYNSNFDNANITLGSSQVWGRGTTLSGTGTNKTGLAGAVGDHYTNSSSGYVYECKTAGTASTAKWDYVKTTAKAAGKKWYGGTTLSGTGTNKTGYAGTVGDYYWNNSSGTYYYCTTTGTSSTAKWDYVGVLTKAYETLYLRGTLDGDIFTAADVPFIAGIPETPDDLYYVAIGSMYSVTSYGLFPEHPIYKFVNGEFKSLNQVAYDAQVATDVINNSLSNYVTTTTYDADWTNRKDEIYSYVNVNYTTTSDFGTYQETMQTALSQKADATTISATATQVVNDAISGMKDTISDIEETFTFDTNGLTIARGGNTMYLQLQNDRLSFRTDGTDDGERAYMTSTEFVLKQLQSFQIGNFKFEVRTNGSLDFKKV